MMDELADLLSKGFFDDAEFFQRVYIGKNGVLDYEGFKNLWESFKGRKFTLKYYLIHGNTIPTWGVPSKYRDQDEVEKLCKECLDENVTWQEKLNYKVPEDGTVG